MLVDKIGRECPIGGRRVPLDIGVVARERGERYRLNGDAGAHNRITSNTNIVDDGTTRSFVRRIENTGVQQVFNATNAQYMRDCIPFDRVNH